MSRRTRNSWAADPSSTVRGPRRRPLGSGWVSGRSGTSARGRRPGPPLAWRVRRWAGPAQADFADEPAVAAEPEPDDPEPLDEELDEPLESDPELVAPSPEPFDSEPLDSAPVDAEAVSVAFSDDDPDPARASLR